MYPKHMTDNHDIRVLLVDDKATDMEMIKIRLNDSDPNLHIDTTTSPYHAYDLIMNLEYDCLVTDYNMPEINGLQLTQLILKETEIPIIMLTGWDDDSVAEAGFKAGIKGYFKKGSDISLFNELAALIRCVVENRRLLSIQ